MKQREKEPSKKWENHSLHLLPSQWSLLFAAVSRLGRLRSPSPAAVADVWGREELPVS